MNGSRNSAILFVISALLLISQAALSLIAFDDWVGAMVAGTLSIVMFLGTGMAYKGGLSAVMNQTVVETPNYDGSYTRTVTTRDTGQRVQATPCCGICGGIMTIIVAYMFGAELGEAIILLAPGFLGGALAIVAGIVFAIEYRGPWVDRAF
ncbi:hypothetical protein EU538_11770 [Candidatus Thorarchaeota archaeon]|nr:MAG: hypothetical protein EU538_11770 [Candidatus Thorarchaeota archaeon]